MMITAALTANSAKSHSLDEMNIHKKKNTLSQPFEKVATSLCMGTPPGRLDIVQWIVYLACRKLQGHDLARRLKV